MAQTGQRSSPVSATGRRLESGLKSGRRSRLGMLMVASVLAACTPGPGAPAGPVEPTVVSGDDLIRLNQLQLIGSHNSYHLAPDGSLLFPLILGSALSPAIVEGLGNPLALNYTHADLATQLGRGIRTFEIDIYADPTGTRFSTPRLPQLLGLANPIGPGVMDQPGFKVIHIADVDFISSCATLQLCLSVVRSWSDARPDHLPIIINLELKGDPLPLPPELGFTSILPFDAVQLDAVDSELRAALGDRLITPDDVRGAAVDLRTAITTSGWPTVKESRGKVLFFMDNADLRSTYLAGHPSLAGRVMFTSSGEGQPDGAILKRNDPADGAAIRDLVEQGYIVRTRTDGPDPADEPSIERRSVALASGAQIVHSDFPPGEPKWNTGYQVTFGTRVAGRCNPVTTTPTTCSPAAAIEP